MKTLFYINTIGKGGAEHVMVQLCSSFASFGDEVTLVTSFRTEGEYRVGPGVERLSIEDEQIEQSCFRRNATRISALRSICKSRRPDVVVSFMREPNFRALLATIGLPARTVVSIRNDPDKEYGGVSGRFVGRVLIPFFADGCVFQTSKASEWFPGSVKRKSQVIPNSVDERFFNVTAVQSGAYWVAVGRLEKQKNYPMMLDAFKEVVAARPREQLRIYGAGSLSDELSDRIDGMGLQDNVRLMGCVDDVASVLAGAKGFLMSSDYEGMPNALMEALAMGLPCVATDCPCGGAGELISDGVSGLLSPVGDAGEFARRVMILLDRPGFAAGLGQAARESSGRYRPAKINLLWHDYIASIAAL